MTMQKTLLLYIAIVLIWGATWLPVKLQLGLVPPSVSVAYRFWLAAGLLLAWCLLRGLNLRFSPRQHAAIAKSEEHTSELQSRENLVCRLLLEKKKKKHNCI